MEAFGHFLTALLSKPRQAWAGLAISAAVLLMLQRFGFGPDEATNLGQSTSLASWVALSVGSTFFALNIGADIWKHLSISSGNRAALKASRDRFINSSPQTRALLTYLVMNSESSVWIMNDYRGLADLVTKGFGYISDKQGPVVEIEARQTVSNWLGDNLDNLTHQELGADARKELLGSMKRAAEELGFAQA